LDVLNSKHKEQQMYWATGLASIASNIVIPLVVYFSLRRSSKTPIEQYNLLVNEIGRQFISGSVGLLSFFGGGILIRSVINFYDKQKSSQNKMDEGDKHLYMLVGAIAAKFISSALIKPLLSTQLILQFLEREKKPLSLPLAQVTALLKNSQSIQEASQKLTDLAQTVSHSEKPELQKGKFSQVLHNAMRKHFFDANNQPKLGKFTAIAVTTKGAWLSLLALSIYALTKQSQQKSNVVNTQGNQQLSTNGLQVSSVMANAPVSSPITFGANYNRRNGIKALSI
jgi:hypothetical protein